MAIKLTNNQVQQALVKAGYKIDVDGIIGKQTEKALRDFQRIKGLTVDGKLGPQSYAALNAILNPLVSQVVLDGNGAAVGSVGIIAPPPGAGSFSVSNHRLVGPDGKPVKFVSTRAMSGTIKPELLVMHWTGANSLQSAVNTFAAANAQASAHLVIGPDGEIVQMVPFNRNAWHAGKSSWKGRANCNGYSIGIELANAGQLQKRADGKYVERIRTSVVVPAKDVLIARHKNGGGELPYQRYPEAQIATALAVAQALNAAYKFKDVVGHDDIAPGRKTDPGPAFPMASFAASVLGRK